MFHKKAALAAFFMCAKRVIVNIRGIAGGLIAVW